MLARVAFRNAVSVRAFASRAAVAPRVLPALAVRPTTISLPAARAYSAAAKLKEEEDDFFNGVPINAVPEAQAAPDAFFTPELTAEAAEPADADAPVPFATLKGRIDDDTLKALTVKPFTLKTMSEVQKRVLSRMPELSGGKTPASLIAGETAEQKEARELREKRGREDLLVKAKTGTGKTIGFLVPAIESRRNTLEALANPAPDAEGNPAPARNVKDLALDKVGTLVISPTRELATQIANEATKLMSWNKDRKVQLFVGGNSRFDQLRNFSNPRTGSKDVVVATPGRLRDLLGEREVARAIGSTDTLILDEADTLLDMGFSQDLNFILEHLPKERQTFLFSATVSPQVKKIARDFLKTNHSVIDCVPEDESNTHEHIPQYVTQLSNASEQLPHLVRLIAHDQLVNPNSKVIVFLPTTKMTMLFATLLREMSGSMPTERLGVYEIHSRLAQMKRTRESDNFRKTTRPSVLITSDVSARGVDYPGVTRVIQIGIPSTPEQYIHRVGRTGRGGKTDGRGDILLLPFEAGFPKHLPDVPFKNVSVDDFKVEVEALAAAASSGQRVGKINDSVSQLLPALDPAAIEDVMGSLIGFYAGKLDTAKANGPEMLEGIKSWSTEGAGLAEAPYFSPAFLAKMGLSEKKQGGGGGARRDRNGGGARGSFGLNRGDSGDRNGGFGDRKDRHRSDGRRAPPQHGGFPHSDRQGYSDRGSSAARGQFSSPRPSREGGAPRRGWESRFEERAASRFGESRDRGDRGDRGSFRDRR
ncbi:hypothetical protein Q8F55_006821 [Vanrija albida]|uniref:ATP-dependent RNA helicase n=1 Tax=Vanrija albida TaxID=181172 RepID=A0ABR3PYB0_9TREE